MGLVIRHIIRLLVILLVISGNYAGADTPNPELTWAYHWGDLPKHSADSSSQAWQFAQADWQPLASLEALPPKQNHSLLWLKLDVPNNTLRDPVLYMNSVDLTLQVFENHQQTFHFGDIDGAGISQFAGWPWLIVPIQTQYNATTLYLRIFSDYYRYIGPSGLTYVGERADVQQSVYMRGLAGFTVIIVIFISGLIITSLGIIKREWHLALPTGVMSLTLSLMMFSENELSQLVSFQPLLWRTLAALSYFSIPLVLAWLIQAWFANTRLYSATTILVINPIGIIGLALASWFSKTSPVYFYPHFDLYFIFVVLCVLTECIWRCRPQATEERLVLLGVVALFTSLLIDMLSAHDIINWIGRTGQWGLVFFSLAMLVVYLVKDWKQQKHLHVLMHDLEEQVEERTKALTQSHFQMRQLASQDYLTGLQNRREFIRQAHSVLANAIRHRQPLSLLLLDIDHFKTVNDDYGHLTGDRVLKALAEIITQTSRQGDLLCRYGGEEFVILLPQTSQEATRSFATRLLEGIRGLSFVSDQGIPFRVTASLGIAAFTLETTSTDTHWPDVDTLLDKLLAKADHAMYSVKHGGRDGMEESIYSHLDLENNNA